MNLRKLTGVAVAAVLALPMFASGANAYELVIPTLDYRTGPYAPNGIPVANGFTDYLNMLNERDGGINGVKIKRCILRNNDQITVGDITITFLEERTREQ